MSDTYVDDSVDPSNFILQDQRRTMANAVTSLSDDPEKATRAVQLGDATGDNPSIIYHNLDDYEAQHKAKLTASLLNSNQFLRQYIDADPMHAKISNDDYGQLDAALESLNNLPDKSYSQQAMDWLKSDSIAKGFEHGFGAEPLGTMFLKERQLESSQDKPVFVPWKGFEPTGNPVIDSWLKFSEATARAGSSVPELALRSINAIVFGVSEGVLGSPVPAEVLLDPGLQATLQGLGPPGAVLAGFQSLLRSAAPYLRDGKNIPAGIHPDLDKIKIDEAKADGDAIKQALTESTASETRERSPEAFASALRQKVGDREIGIDAEAVRKLYGDKIPAAGDNILGWVPDLAERMASAEGVGGDIRVPLADWLAHVDKDVAKELHDNIRVRDGGLTLEEAKGLEPKEVIADPLQLTRGEGGFEPQFSLGDRKVKLERMQPGGEVKGPFGPEQGFHDFNLLDETGKTIGVLNLSEAKGGKQIYVEMIQAGATDKMYDPNFLGPAIIRDLRRQIKAEFPNAETITGHRVSGAREKAGTYEAKHAMPVIKLSQEAPEGWGHVDSGPTLRELFQEIGGQTIDQTYSALHYAPELEPHKIALDAALRKELARIAPTAKVFTPDVISAVPERPGFARRGFHQQFREQAPWIVVALDNAKAMGVAFHEAIHHLRQEGFFTEAEWSTLERAARQNDWMTKFEINKRYGDLHEEGKIEESIAEAFREWKNATDRKIYPPGINALFQKMQDFFDALRTRVKEITGKDLSWDEVFQRVDTGEVGGREGTGPRKEGAFKASDELAPSAMDEGLFEKAKAMGVTEAHMNRMLKLIEKRNEEDRVKAEARAEKQQKRSQTAEWKNRRTEIRDDVREQLASRPDLATDELFAQQKIKLNPDYLSEEQKAALPKDYIQRKNGVNPDDLAPYFGYTSGDALVERLGLLTSDRKSAGMSQRDYFNRLVDVETDRRLNAEFGDLGQNIMDAAKDQALSETQLDLVHEETLAYALAAGAEPKFTKEQVREMVKGQFDLTPVRDISSDRLIQTAGKLGRKIEDAASKGDWAEAYRISQQRNYATIAAKLAREYERGQRQLDRTAKTFRKREVPSVAQEYTNWVHDLLQRVGYSINRNVQDLTENIARQSEGTLEKFIISKEAEWQGNRTLPIADAFVDPSFRKSLKDLSYSNFKEFKNAIDMLVKAGRDEKKIYREGDAADKAQVIGEMRGKIKTFPQQLLPDERNWLQEKAQQPKKFIAGLTAIPTLLRRFERNDPQGIFSRYITYPMREADNTHSTLQREVSKSLKEIGPLKNSKKLVDSPFPDPKTRTEENPDGTAWNGFMRKHVLGMLAHAGNASNWRVLAKGYSSDPAALMQWLIKNTTKEDWAQAQKRGDLIFKDLIGKSDRVYERTEGVTVEKIPLEPIANVHGNFAGWYHPLDADPIRKEVWLKDPNTGSWTRNAVGKRDSVMDKYGKSYATTANGYTKGRSGAVYPLDLDITAMNGTINQMIHDISYREPLLEIQKIFQDESFRNEIDNHYGVHYKDLLTPWLQDMAGQASVPNATWKWVGEWSEYLRQNVISTYIGGNIYTALKHGPTALVMSSRVVGAREFLPQFGKQLIERLAGDPLRKALEVVGADNYAEAVKSLYARSPELGLTMSEFAMKYGESLQRRERHWQDTIAGETKELKGESTLREKIIQKGSWLVAQSDMLSAKPTWIGEFNKRQREGLSLGESFNLADDAVTRAHGTTGRSDMPALVRGGGPAHSWLTSVYGFMGTRMQRMIEIGHQLNDIHQLGKEAELKAAAARIPKLLGDMMTFAVWPIIVEEAVVGLGTEDRRTALQHLASGITLGMSSSVLYLRDFIHGLSSGHEPGVGLLSSAAHDAATAVKDLMKGREAFNKQYAGKTVADILTLLGEVKGVSPKVVGNAARFGIDLVNNQTHPRSASEVFRGATRGTTKLRVER